MKQGRSILFVLLLALVSACSNTRFLTGSEMLYTGKDDPVIINPYNIRKEREIRNNVESITDHRINNSLFGKRMLPPVGLWVYNYLKPGSGAGKLGKWFYKTFSSAPVLVSEVNPALRCSKIENDLFDKGYFNARVTSVIDTSRKNPRKGRVTYTVSLKKPYTYNKISLDSLEGPADTLIRSLASGKQLRPGEQFDLEKLKAGRKLLVESLQNAGYFYFSPDFIEFRADTSAGDYLIDMKVSVIKDLPPEINSPYRINDITIRNSQGKADSTESTDTILIDGLRVIARPDILKPATLAGSVLFRKGDVYSLEKSLSTTNRLNNLGIFKYVNTSFSRNMSDSLNYILDMDMELVMADNINLDIEGDLATKSSGYFGPLVSATVMHNNAFRGAEKLRAGVTAGFEWQWASKSNTQLGNVSYQFGITSGLTLPRLIFPFSPEKNTRLVSQRTTLGLDLSLLNRMAYYKMFSTRTSLGYQFSRDNNIRHNLYPAYMNSVNLLATTPEFDSVVTENIYIRKSFEEQNIIGPRYDFVFNNTLNIKPSNFYFQGGISTSATLIDILAGINKTPGERPYTILNNVYSQFIKFTSDFRYYRNMYKKSLVFRLYAGVGIPYGNSEALPYVEQFFSGGAYSIRAFTARYLGPGSFHTDDQSGYIDQSGDIKLESNLEFRFDMSKMLKGAIFVDAGNIWLVNEDVSRPGARFNSSTFYREIAVGSGFGLRFDFSFFVLRADLGIPLRTPYSTDGSYWITRTGDAFSNSIFNLAIGYPF